MKEKKANMLLKLLGDYRFNSILVKSFFSILVVLLCTFAIVMWQVSRKIDDVIESEVATMSRNTLNQTKERMDTLMNEVVQISGQMSLDEDIMKFLLPEGDGGRNKEATLAAKDQIRMYSGLFDYIDSIYVYSSKLQYVVTSDGGGPLEEFDDLTWHSNLTERIYEPGRMISRVNKPGFPYFLSYIQPIRLTQMQFLGGIIVNIDIDKLDDQMAVDSSEELLIVDDRDNVIFANRQENLMKKWTELPLAQLVDKETDTGSQSVKAEDGEQIFTVLHSSDFKWRYVSVVPMRKYQEYQREFGSFYVLTIMLILILSVIAAVLISVYTYNPVKNILNLLKNPDIYEPVGSAKQGFKQDEIQEITGNIVRNFYSNRQMQKELEDYLNLVNKAQLAALQAQISPHFLFNTLENLRWRAIAICKGDNEVSQIILNLSEMLRISLDNSRQIISLEEEIKNARLYIEILQLRYADKIKVEWNISEELKKCQIVKVSLQPLIENAVYHGIKPLRGQGIISISAFSENERVKIRVRDNGVGMSQEECRLLNEDLKSAYQTKEGHIGVRNVGQRLKLILGDAAEMSLRSAVGEGTTVTISLPLHFVEIDTEKQGEHG
ncbi:MAG: sensor histidine kinase [Lachnospiraceae bacterium]|nr:sensor histidine kinase [Lachnospiraceae bacterium]